MEIVDIEQGTAEWLALRRSKITATDAPIIMGASKWKTRAQLLREKKDPFHVDPINVAMERGRRLEPFARQLFTIKTGMQATPYVIVRNWAMASLDGLTDDKTVLEIKCPIAGLHDSVPAWYMPQIQHQMWVVDAQKAIYFTFDGIDGRMVNVDRDEKFIQEMIAQEASFYEDLIKG